ncbi:MAG: aminotransferase class IV [Acidobacteria bacterium]|nr:aminotransferase class IV [Acidobacteriota bacterium]
MRELVNLNGEIRARERAVISVFDRGFLYGDSVYETLRTYGQVPFLLERHLDRLAASAGRIGIPVPDRGRIGSEAAHTCSAADPGEYLVRIVVTRGEGPAWPEGPPVGLDPSPCRRPNLVIFVVPFPEGIEALQERGVAVSIVPVRRNPAVALDPSIKSSNQLNNILAVAARGRSAFEAIMRNPQGYVAEGASSNVFIVRGGEAWTPPLAAGILEGITREVVLRLAADAGIPAREADILPEDLVGAEECFLTSTIKEVMPIVDCDGRRIGSGRPGPVTRELQGRFRALVAASHPPR